MIGKWCLSQLQETLEGVLHGDDVEFNGVSIDTRTIVPGNVFLALKGPNFDGHRFVAQALEKGAVAAIVSELQPGDISQLQVEDTHAALGLLGKQNRQRSEAQIVAVTGSAGKTTVKEMLAAILRTQGNTLATRGNLNNDIGAPLTLMELEGDHQFGVIELGASAEKEIEYTVGLTLPRVSILTNAMGAHLEGFGSLQGVVRAKGEIFDVLPADGVAVINADDPHAPIWLARAEQTRRITFGVENVYADVNATRLEVGANGCYQFYLMHQEHAAEVELRVLGRHNVANAAAAAAAIVALGLPLEVAAQGLAQFLPVKGRMYPHTLEQGVHVIDDTYNANPGSVKAAIDMLATLPGKQLLVLGDMAELGETAAEQHADIGDYAAQKGTDRLLAVGALSSQAVETFNTARGISGGAYASKEELIAALQDFLEPGMTVLVKGSRSAGMEQVVAGLVEGNH